MRWRIFDLGGACWIENRRTTGFGAASIAIVGAEAIFESISQVSAKKPVVAVMGEIAASGGYIAALASDYIISRKNSLTGSVGVIIQYPNFSKLIQQTGVSVETIRSGDEKGGQNPFLPIDPVKRKNEIELVEDGFDWFLSLVKAKRKINDDKIQIVSSGKLFSGKRALDLGPVDALGSETQAIKYLESLDPSYGNLPVIDRGNGSRSDAWWLQFLPMEKGHSLLAIFNNFTGPTMYSLAR